MSRRASVKLAPELVGTELRVFRSEELGPVRARANWGLVGLVGTEPR